MPPKILPDHNGGVSETTFFHHLKTLDDLERQANSIKGKLKAQWEKAIDDGIDKDDLKVVMKDRAKPVSERIKSFNNRNLYRRFLKMPEASEMPVLDETYSDEVGLSEEERAKKWEDDGYVAGKLGKNRDECPHEDPNSLGARHWMLGYERGQAENAKGIKKKAPEPAADTKANGKASPQHEPEVQEAKKRGRPAKGAGVTYWHNAETKKVYEITSADAQPEGATAITRPEYDKLKAEYDKQVADDWDAASPGDDSPPPPPAA